MCLQEPAEHILPLEEVIADTSQPGLYMEMLEAHTSIGIVSRNASQSGRTTDENNSSGFGLQRVTSA